MRRFSFVVGLTAGPNVVPLCGRRKINRSNVSMTCSVDDGIEIRIACGIKVEAYVTRSLVLSI